MKAQGPALDAEVDDYELAFRITTKLEEAGSVYVGMFIASIQSGEVANEIRSLLSPDQRRKLKTSLQEVVTWAEGKKDLVHGSNVNQRTHGSFDHLIGIVRRNVQILDM